MTLLVGLTRNVCDVTIHLQFRTNIWYEQLLGFVILRVLFLPSTKLCLISNGPFFACLLEDYSLGW